MSWHMYLNLGTYDTCCVTQTCPRRAGRVLMSSTFKNLQTFIACKIVALTLGFDYRDIIEALETIQATLEVVRLPIQPVP